MLLHVLLLLAGLFCPGFRAEPPYVTVLQNTLVVLPCPDRNQDVTWTRYRGGNLVTLVTIKDSSDRIHDKHFGSLSDNSLLIRNVKLSDSGMYFCNGKQIYLNVTTDPNLVTPRRDGSVTPRNNGLGPHQNGSGAAEPEDQRSLDLWKAAVGGAVGAALVLLAVLTLRLWSKRDTQETNTNRTATEMIYEEVGEEQPNGQSEVESPYYWTISDMPSTSTPPANNLYSTVNKLKPQGRSTEECVYHLAQHAQQTGNISK